MTVAVERLDAGRTGFYVPDDGSGVDEADRDRIFDHGYSTDQAGTGYGLAIVEDIVDAHDWHIEVATSADSGARFEDVPDGDSPEGATGDAGCGRPVGGSCAVPILPKSPDSAVLTCIRYRNGFMSNRAKTPT